MLKLGQRTLPPLPPRRYSTPYSSSLRSAPSSFYFLLKDLSFADSVPGTLSFSLYRAPYHEHSSWCSSPSNFWWRWVSVALSRVTCGEDICVLHSILSTPLSPCPSRSTSREWISWCWGPKVHTNLSLEELSTQGWTEMNFWGNECRPPLKGAHGH